jgi:hypothetical protein
VSGYIGLSTPPSLLACWQQPLFWQQLPKSIGAQRIHKASKVDTFAGPSLKGKIFMAVPLSANPYDSQSALLCCREYAECPPKRFTVSHGMHVTLSILSCSIHRKSVRRPWALSATDMVSRALPAQLSVPHLQRALWAAEQAQWTW